MELGAETVGACRALEDPGADPELGRTQASGTRDDYQIDAGYSNEDLRAELFNRIIKMAFACDLTRSISLMYTHFHCWMNFYELIGREADLHELGHSLVAKHFGVTVAPAVPMPFESFPPGIGRHFVMRLIPKGQV